MATYGKYTLTPDQVKFIQHETASVCEGVDFELCINDSDSMSDLAEPGKPATRFDVGLDFLLALAEPVMGMDDRIGVRTIKNQEQSSGPVDAVRRRLTLHTCGEGTPLREVLRPALQGYINRLEKYPNTKPFNFIIAGDGYDREIADIVQEAAERIWEITQQDPRKKLGIQFILVTTDRNVVETFDGFDNITAHKYGEHIIEAGIINVTTITQINDMGGIDSLLCKAKILGGTLIKPLGNMLKDIEKTQNKRPTHHSVSYHGRTGLNSVVKV
ncbi:hypothetical protein QBC47DRAFT_403572 [Echria macrotheca]|uniref:VWFA domain-containing protein n=1 Tax=Echria macrotheca TaxID=438768 RepID=A0AAJ0F561_9PEZI|nr:hypothetical protein QBC47DRAFT_403572 [Echria macrotheca]